MNCEQISNQLIAYLDGRANAAERRNVEAHLAGCAACRLRAEEFRRLWDVLDETPALEPSLGFDARLRQRIAAEPRPRLWGSPAKAGWPALADWLMPSPRLVFAVTLLALMSVWVSSRPPAKSDQLAVAPQSEQEFQMIKDLRVLEDLDVVSSLDALSELPPSPPAQAPAQTHTNREM
jgi:anti-sigma factor RsiW